MSDLPHDLLNIPKSKAQRQAESRAAELDRPRREREEYRSRFASISERLTELGIDPDDLWDFMHAPRPN